jgi:hypothetical protein
VVANLVKKLPMKLLYAKAKAVIGPVEDLVWHGLASGRYDGLCAKLLNSRYL